MKELKELFGYQKVWHLIGRFERSGFTHYEEQWVNNPSLIEATVNVWKREGATEIIQLEYGLDDDQTLYKESNQ